MTVATAPRGSSTGRASSSGSRMASSRTFVRGNRTTISRRSAPLLRRDDESEGAPSFSPTPGCVACRASDREPPVPLSLGDPRGASRRDDRSASRVGPSGRAGDRAPVRAPVDHGLFGGASRGPRRLKGARGAEDSARRGGARDGLAIGSIVRHPTFGSGRIVDREGEGKTLKLTIHFAGQGSKKILPAYTQLEILAGRRGEERP